MQEHIPIICFLSNSSDLTYYLFTYLQFLNRMSTDFDQLSLSIAEEQNRIQENQAQRNKKFNQCLDAFLNHLKQQTNQLESTQQQNDIRNELISSAFENTYERIMTSSQVTLRKIKQTCYQKKEFWKNLIQNNAELPDLELKKDFYQQKRDAEDRYRMAVDSQKVKRIPYNLLLGKLKQRHSLKDWQVNNKKLEDQVVKGTKTINQWKVGVEKNQTFQKSRQSGNDSTYVLNQFTSPEGSSPWKRNGSNSRYNAEEAEILNSFQIRRQ